MQADFDERMLYALIEQLLNEVNFESVEGATPVVLIVGVGIIVKAYGSVVIEFIRGVCSVIEKIISAVEKIIIKCLSIKNLKDKDCSERSENVEEKAEKPPACAEKDEKI